MPLTVQVSVEALRNWTVIQMVPAAPSLPWTDPCSAEGSQRTGAGGSPDGLAVEGGRSGPAPGFGVPVGAELTRDAVAGSWEAADGWLAVETAR
jgi:hypothetical protein